MWVWNRSCNSKARLDGKTAVVTGCNTGIGKETVLDFVKRGARVVMACRDMKKAEAAADEIRKATQGLEGAGEVVLVDLDLASLESVRNCAENLLRTEPQINILVNNAGVMACPKGITKDGHEMQFGINHLGHFLFTLLLLPRILNSAPARIVNVSSHAHWIGGIDFEDLNWERKYSPTFAYARSKLANVLFAKELAEKLKGTGVTTYSLHPGVVSTELMRHFDSSYFKGSTWFINKIGGYFIKTPKQGAQTSIYCAVHENAASESGFYYSNCTRFWMWGNARNSEMAKKLWDVSIELVGLKNYDPFNTPGK